MHDTKVLLQQSREKLVITYVTFSFGIILEMLLTLDRDRRVADDIAGFDSNQYQMAVIPGESGDGTRFHVGEVIRVKWKAPPNHSRKDWIGIYRVSVGSLPVGLLNDRLRLVGRGEQRQIGDKGSLDGDVGTRTQGRMGRRQSCRGRNANDGNSVQGSRFQWWGTTMESWKLRGMPVSRETDCPIQLALDPLSPRREIQCDGDDRIDRSIR